MAFKLCTNQKGVTAPLEYRVGTNNEAYDVGEALVQSSGGLTKCGATTKPTFICMGVQAAEATATALIPVMRVSPDQEFEVPIYGDPSSLNVGDIVTLHTDGLQATVTASSGVFTITGFPSKVTNGVMRGYFADRA